MIPRRVESVELVEQDDGLVAFLPDRARVHFLNPTGALVLELCDGVRTDEEIVALVQELFALPAPPTDEVRALLAQALDEGLIEV